MEIFSLLKMDSDIIWLIDLVDTPSLWILFCPEKINCAGKIFIFYFKDQNSTFPVFRHNKTQKESLFTNKLSNLNSSLGPLLSLLFQSWTDFLKLKSRWTSDKAFLDQWSCSIVTASLPWQIWVILLFSSACYC